MFDSILFKDIEFYDKNKTGELLSRISNDISTVYSVCTDNISIFMQSSLQLLGSLALLWFLSWKLTLFIIVLTPLVTLIIFRLIKKMKDIQKQYSNNVAFSTALATEVFSNIRVVRSFSNEMVESRNYGGLLGKVFSTGRRKHMLSGIMVLIITFFINVLLMVVLYFGGRLVIDGQLSIGDLTSFVLYSISLTISFSSVSGTVNRFISAIGISEQLF